MIKNIMYVVSFFFFFCLKLFDFVLILVLFIYNFGIWDIVMYLNIFINEINYMYM